MRRPIGGYFELELPHFPEYHAEAIALNSGRFCLEYLLRCRHYKKIYVPYYTCDTAIEPLQKLGIPYSFYHIDTAMHLVDDIQLSEGEALLYTNYWGLQNDYCEALAIRYGHQLILDYTQAFFSRPIVGIDTFYSCRKFFGVPDGGYLYTDAVADFDIAQDESYTRMDSLVKRIDLSPEAGFEDFHQVSAIFHSIPMLRMSNFTKRMMNGMDYQFIRARRIKNYNMLSSHFNQESLNPCGDAVPMAFPYLCEAGQDLRKRLISQKVFVAKYWPNVDQWADQNSLEYYLANHLLPLPVDQRYDEEDMSLIIQLIENA